jgi:hypothetical protein
VRVVILVTPPALAVIVTRVAVAVVAVTAVNVAVLLFWATDTDVGTVTNDVELSERPTLNVPEATLELSVTVHVLDWPPITAEGEQDTPVNATVN